MSIRDAHGYFAVGNPGSPGRRTRPQELQYVEAVTKACPPAKLLRIVRKVAEAAIGGDIMAQALILKYCLPDPAKAHAAFETQFNQPLRIGGSASREAFEEEMIARALDLAEERMAKQRRLPKIKRLGVEAVQVPVTLPVLEKDVENATE
jgi:hypothetical protein